MLRAASRLFPLLTAFAAIALLSLPAPLHADASLRLPVFDLHGPRHASVNLLTHELQPISYTLAFRVNEASVKDRQLWVIGEVVNTSRITFSQVRLILGVAHGAEQRLILGRLVPGGKRRVQVRLATEFAHAPAELHVVIVEAVPDYRPKPQRWPSGPELKSL